MVNVQNDAWFGLSLTFCTIFKIRSQFSENYYFLENCKHSDSSICQYFECFQSGAPSCSHAHSELVENLVKEMCFLKKCVFTPKAKHYQITSLRCDFDKLKFKSIQIYHHGNL